MKEPWPRGKAESVLNFEVDFTCFVWYMVLTVQVNFSQMLVEDASSTSLEDLKALVTGLLTRIEKLEQLQQLGGQPGHIEHAETKPQYFKNKASVTNQAAKEEDQLANNDSLLKFFEMRVQFVTADDKVNWKLMSQEDHESQTTPFRYDVDKDDNLTFSVYKTSKLFKDLYEHCNPAHYGQVREIGVRLEFQDLNPLIRRLEELQHDSEKRSDIPELKALLQLLEGDDRQIRHLRRAAKRYLYMKKAERTDWEGLKSLFHRGQLVTFRELREEWAVARVTMVSSNELHFSSNSSSNRPRVMGEVCLLLECEAIDFDGKTCRTHVYRKEIPLFTGDMKITELPVYPLDRSPSEKQIRQDSIRSGEIWKKMHEDLGKDGQPNVAVMKYEGYCQTFGKDAKDNQNGGKGSTVRFSHLGISKVLNLR